MRRWNGWGDEANDFPLKPEAQKFLLQQIGAAAALDVNPLLSSFGTRSSDQRDEQSLKK